MSPQFGDLFRILPELRIVVDTNWVLSDLLWLVGRRRKEDARTCLQEAIDAGMILPLVPKELPGEVEKHIPRLATEEDVSLARLEQEWQKYRQKLRVVTIETIPRDNVADPKDLPFVYLYEQTAAMAVLSRDGHIRRMGARIAGVDVALHLRNYARAKSVEVTLIFPCYLGHDVKLLDVA